MSHTDLPSSLLPARPPARATCSCRHPRCPFRSSLPPLRCTRALLPGLQLLHLLPAGSELPAPPAGASWHEWEWVGLLPPCPGAPSLPSFPPDATNKIQAAYLVDPVDQAPPPLALQILSLWWAGAATLCCAVAWTCRSHMISRCPTPLPYCCWCSPAAAATGGHPIHPKSHCTRPVS